MGGRDVIKVAHQLISQLVTGTDHIHFSRSANKAAQFLFEAMDDQMLAVPAFQSASIDGADTPALEAIAE